jgi:hypothetical protein
VVQTIVVLDLLQNLQISSNEPVTCRCNVLVNIGQARRCAAPCASNALLLIVLVDLGTAKCIEYLVTKAEQKPSDQDLTDRSRMAG